MGRSGPGSAANGASCGCAALARARSSCTPRTWRRWKHRSSRRPMGRLASRSSMCSPATARTRPPSSSATSRRSRRPTWCGRRSRRMPTMCGSRCFSTTPASGSSWAKRSTGRSRSILTRWPNRCSRTSPSFGDGASASRPASRWCGASAPRRARAPTRSGCPTTAARRGSCCGTAPAPRAARRSGNPRASSRCSPWPTAGPDCLAGRSPRRSRPSRRSCAAPWWTSRPFHRSTIRA